jgi:hypothetical protein
MGNPAIARMPAYLFRDTKTVHILQEKLTLSSAGGALFYRRGWSLGLALIVGISACTSDASPPQPSIATEPTAQPETEPAIAPTPAAPFTYETRTFPHSQVHWVTVPPNGAYRLGVGVAATLMPLADLAAETGAIAAINAGFFDPQNGFTTSYITQAGDLVADPRQNPRLMENPDLAPYLEAILDRSEFRIYTCNGTVQYDITRHSAPVPSGCELESAVGAGPQLLPRMTGYEEGFMADNVQGELVRDALGSQYPNARSAVGLKADGTVVLAIAAQRPDPASPTGMGFQDLADFLASLGVEKALNLDGGSSSGLYVEGQTYYGRLDDKNQFVQRPIKSILVVQ